MDIFSIIPLNLFSLAIYTIEGLVKDGYIVRSKNTITSTPTGMNLIEVVPQELRSPKLTVDWEEKLQKIEKGELDSDDFLGEIQAFISQITHNRSNIKIDSTLFPSGKEVLGKCPRCGTSVVFSEKHKNFYCENKTCSFSLWEDNKFFASMGKKITKGMVKDFLSKGETFVSGLVSKKTGKAFNATVTLDDTGQYIHFALRFGDK